MKVFVLSALVTLGASTLATACGGEDGEANGDNPLAGVDCEGDNADDDEKCDYIICNSGYDLLADDPDCGEDYVDCVFDECSPGDDVANADFEDLTHCAKAYEACLRDAEEEDE